MNVFSSWIKSREIWFNEILCVESAGDSAGLGLFLKMPAVHGQHSVELRAPLQLAKIPKSFLLSSVDLEVICAQHASVQFAMEKFLEAVRNGAESRRLDRAVREERWRLQLVLLLGLYYADILNNEKLLELKPYFDILPRKETFQTPVFWTREQQELLRDTPLALASAAKLRKLQHEFETLEKHFLPYLKGFNIDFSDYLWADALIWSRAFSFQSQLSWNGEGSDLHMVPLFDLANHSNEPNCRWEICDGSLKLLTYDCMTLMPSMELLLSYGCKSNDELLFTHGFCIENNMYDSMEVHCTSMLGYLGEDPLIDQKLHLIKNENNGMIRISRQMLDSTKCSRVDFLDEQSRFNMLMLVLDEDDLNALETNQTMDFESKMPILETRIVVILNELSMNVMPMKEHPENPTRERLANTYRESLNLLLGKLGEVCTKTLESLMKNPEIASFFN